MADEVKTENSESAPAAEALAVAAPVKKTRAPRRSKAEIEADAAVKSAAKASKASRAPKAPSVKSEKAPSVTVKATPVAAKAETKKQAPVPPVDGLDDIATLIALQEENNLLRKQLSDKLRAENADLRKRLG